MNTDVKETTEWCKMNITSDSPLYCDAKSYSKDKDYYDDECAKSPYHQYPKFYEHETLVTFPPKAQTICSWDFNVALGDTIMEKYESLYVKLVEITSVMIAKGAKGFFWIVASPEVVSIFETATAGFIPAISGEQCNVFGQIPMGVAGVYYKGMVNQRWRLYSDTDWVQNLVLIGCDDCEEYARLHIANFCI